MLLALLMTEVQAAPMMWGVGPNVGTTVYPVRFPGQFPAAMPNSWNFEPAYMDVQLNARTIAYVTKDARIGVRGGFGGGSGWSNRSFSVEYENVVGGKGGVDFLVGGGVGLGKDTFTDTNADELHVRYALGRVQAGGIYRDKTRAYEFDVSAQYHVPLEHMLYTGSTSQEVKGKGSRYGAIMIEGTVYFGDFKPPKKNGRGGRGGGGRGR